MHKYVENRSKSLILRTRVMIDAYFNLIFVRINLYLAIYNCSRILVSILLAKELNYNVRMIMKHHSPPKSRIID